MKGITNYIGFKRKNFQLQKYVSDKKRYKEHLLSWRGCGALWNEPLCKN
jgi:hypothetical protein